MSSRVSRASIAFLLLFACAAVGAQQVYRIVGPDGKVTFTDQPPPPSAGGRSGPVAATASSGGSMQMPLELREATSRFPVTLFTGAKCEPCDAGRNLLNGRGVPFNERSVSSAEDGEALRRLAGDNSLPLLTLGSQQIKGFSDVEWHQYLDAAGYPRSSRLPSGFRNSPVTPLVSTQRASTPTAQAPAAGEAAQPPVLRSRVSPSTAPPAEAEQPDDNPGGIRF